MHKSMLISNTLVLLMATSASAQPEQAEKILKETGVTGGLVVHVGCGDGRLTAALRTRDSLLVHGLDRDEANIAKARAYLQAARPARSRDGGPAYR